VSSPASTPSGAPAPTSLEADLALALRELARFERSVIRQFAPFDAVLTPALALPPRPIG